MIDERLSRLMMRSYYSVRTPGALAELDALVRSENQSEEALRDLQMQRLHRTIEHAAKHVPYYRRLLAELGASAEDFRSLEDLRPLSPLTRATVRAQGSELLDERLNRLRLLSDSTGGSTGTPVTFCRSTESRRVGFASMWRAWFLFPGYDLGVRHMRFWGADRDEPHPVLRVFGRVFFNQTFLNSFCATRRQISRALDQVERMEPRLLIAYASSAELLARCAREEGREVRIPSIVCSAETLTGEQRALLAETFGSRVHNAYGCREVGAIAQECVAGDGLHVNVETQVVEFEPVDPGTPNGPCRVLVTNLHNMAMPLIRYDLGDTVQVGGLRWERCACGRTLPRMHPVVGRVSDIIRSPRGTLVHGEYFTHLFYNQNAVAAFQVHQTDLDRLVLRLVPGERYADQFVASVKQRISSDHGFTNINVEICDVIHPEPSGKLRFTRSDLDPRGHDA